MQTVGSKITEDFLKVKLGIDDLAVMIDAAVCHCVSIDREEIAGVLQSFTGEQLRRGHFGFMPRSSAYELIALADDIQSRPAAPFGLPSETTS